MNRDAISELFDYTGWAWERTAGVIDGLPDGTYAADVPGSGWPSIAACLTHFVASYDGWINQEFGGIELGELSYPGEWPAPVNDWSEMKAYQGRVRTSFRQALAVPDETLYAKREFKLEAIPEQLSRADILANLVIHERGHHGDLNTLFHQLGVKSYFIDFRFFRTLPNEFLMDEG